MKRKALSSRLIGEKIVFFALLVLTLLFCVKHYPELLFVAAPILIILDYLIYYRADKIEYDDDSLFIKRRNRDEEVVALKDIYLVKMTVLGIGYKMIWKIKYANNKGEGVARFYPYRVTTVFLDFLKLAKMKNPQAEIKNLK